MEIEMRVGGTEEAFRVRKKPKWYVIDEEMSKWDKEEVAGKANAKTGITEKAIWELEGANSN